MPKNMQLRQYTQYYGVGLLSYTQGRGAPVGGP